MSTIAAGAAAFADGHSEPRSGSPPLAVEVSHDLASVRAAWLGLEGDAVMAPYGRLDWIEAYAAERLDPRAIRVAVARDVEGRVAMILPVALERRYGLTIGSGVGGKHANFNMPVLRPDLFAALQEQDAAALLRQVGRALRVDVLAMSHVPVAWAGRPNPFAAEGRPSPSDAWAVRLAGDGDATLARSMSADARKKLRAKERGLAKLGAVELLRARDPGEVDLILGAFLRQKEERFRELGISDPFADENMRSFMRRAALTRLDEGCPPVELYALMVADHPVAVLGAAGDRHRLSGMFLSFEQGEAARFSPGDVLVTAVIRRQCELGRETFDLGVGDARYKRSLLDTVERLVEVTVPITARGRIYAGSRALAVDLKRRAKATPAVVDAVARLRRSLASLRR